MQSDEEIKEALEHRQVILDIEEILKTLEGQRFFKYVLKYFEVGELPPAPVEGDDRRFFEKLGTLRAGVSIFNLMTEANVVLAGQLLAQKEKERYEALYMADLPTENGTD